MVFWEGLLSLGRFSGWLVFWRWILHRRLMLWWWLLEWGMLRVISK